jgi:L-aminopeptidase/D-esterase-like protein
MICYEFKGGSGTASRKLSAKDGGYTVGAFVQANCGLRKQLTIAGVPVGQELASPPAIWSQDTGSIIIVIATDAPLLPHQLNRVARRASMGLARTGSVSGNGSGDLFLAFSTANHDAFNAPDTAHVDMLSNERISAVFEAAVEATEEAIVNALVAAEPMTGQGGHFAPALPHEAVRDLLKRHLRLAN